MNSAVYDVRKDAHFFSKDICKFLEVKSNHFSITDTNNNAKSLCCHLIEVSCLQVSGIHVIDAQMLQVFSISNYLWRLKDFASDILVLNLDSSETVKILTDTIIIGEDSAPVGSLFTSLYFLRLGLHSSGYKHVIIFSVVLYDMDNQNQKYLSRHQEEHSDIYNWCIVSC